MLSQTLINTWEDMVKRIRESILHSAILCFVLIGANAHSQTNPIEDAVGRVLEHLSVNRMDYQLSERDLNDPLVSDQYMSRKSGVTHVYLNQRHGGIEVYNAILNGSVNPEGQVIHTASRFISSLAEKIDSAAPVLSAEQALLRAADHLDLIPDGSLAIIQSAQGVDQQQLFNSGGLSRENIPARLIYYPTASGAVQLAWSLNIRPVTSADWWHIFVAADEGEILGKHNWMVSHKLYPRPRVKNTLANPVPGPVATRTQTNKLGPSSQYFVVPFPSSGPDAGPLELLSDPFDPASSPFGWHDTDGAPGAEFTTTEGNNVHAFEDRDGNFTPSGNDPDGGANLLFNLVPDFSMPPSTYTGAATVNLFYWNNVVHDIMHNNGFDEPSGNFQENNYGLGGLGNDSVAAMSQWGADNGESNNAFFGTPPDGATPTMRMLEWTGPPTFDVESPLSIAGSYFTAPGNFGGTFPAAPGMTGSLELVDDQTAPSSSDACETLVGFTAGNIAILDRGDCEFGVKVLNAEMAGAVAAIVINNQGNNPTPMGPGVVGGSVTIPSLMIGQDTGEIIKAVLAEPTPVTATMTDGPPNRGSDYDSGVITHEYGHGISNRLTGGPGTAGCLQNDEQGGEGWSDFFALVVTAKADQVGADARGIGTYSSFQPLTGPGIRPFPYSTDMAINPFTYADVGDQAVPHGVGAVWATILWDLYWAFVERDGFDPDLYNGSGGNNTALQLVIEGLKMQACSPGFVDARDGIIAADNGANTCLIWNVFARRGLGLSASQGSNGVVGDETAAFDVPMGCGCIAGGISDQPDSASVCPGETVEFSVVATGIDLEYQWQLNGTDIPGATLSSLSLINVDEADEGNYTCDITNDCTDLTTNIATLTVADPLVYGNALLPGWNAPFAPPACDDHNGNGIFDVLDLVNLITVE